MQLLPKYETGATRLYDFGPCLVLCDSALTVLHVALACAVPASDSVQNVQ